MAQGERGQKSSDEALTTNFFIRKHQQEHQAAAAWRQEDLIGRRGEIMRDYRGTQRGMVQ